jgi:sulfite exporter TauE/SafE
MQAYALTTGSFMTGGLTMLVFALGTLPVLALLSFSSFSINNKPWRGVFFKTAGVIVITLAAINLLTTLAVAGIIEPIF